MTEPVALRLMSEIMQWDNDTCQAEYAWLSLMASLKYDGYRDFRAGMRFIESLADWLQQFEIEDRAAAYGFVRDRLVYIGPAELKHLVELFYPEVIQRQLREAVATELGIPGYLAWSNNSAVDLYALLLRKCLFLSLSDGARTDDFRRANAGIISNEQVVPTFQVDTVKWDDLLEELRKSIGNRNERFRFLYVVDDFVGSGTSLIRHEVDGVNATWKGKLVRLWENIQPKLATHFDPNWTLIVHHYLSTLSARQEIANRNELAFTERGPDNWFGNVKFTFGMVFPSTLPIDPMRDPGVYSLIQGRYYDPELETKHTGIGGTSDVRLGFGNCALPLVIEHNAPNNSIPLIWAETSGTDGFAMRPLFRRRQRHL